MVGRREHGPDGLAGAGDDVAAVRASPQRLLGVAKAASDTTTGILVVAGQGQDVHGQGHPGPDRGLGPPAGEAQGDRCTRQFTAMETALSSLQNQSTWLAGQINSLPS